MTLGKIGARPMVKSWTARDYVRDGLVAMWDGIENAGWGVHDPNATTWKDLAGTNDAVLTVNGSFGRDCLVCAYSSSSTDSFAAYADGEPYPLGQTYVECVFKYEGVNLNRSMIFALRGFESNNDSNIRQIGFVSQRFYWGTASSSRTRGFSGVMPNVKYSLSGNLIQSPFAPTIRINGVATTADLPGAGWLSVSLSQTEIGGSSLKNSNTSFVGKIFCLRIYSSAPSDAEIAHNYNIDKARFNLP